MDYLYAPWRSSYVGSTKNIQHQHACVFCEHINARDDEKNLIIARFEHCVVMLNKFPYNKGHVLVIPSCHEACLENMTVQARTELMELTSRCAAMLKKLFNAGGINIGMNLGKVAGASIPPHLHMHVLPRWQGDTNFLSILGQTRHISFDVYEIYQVLRKAFSEL